MTTDDREIEFLRDAIAVALQSDLPVNEAYEVTHVMPAQAAIDHIAVLIHNGGLFKVTIEKVL